MGEWNGEGGRTFFLALLEKRVGGERIFLILLENKRALGPWIAHLSPGG